MKPDRPRKKRKEGAPRAEEAKDGARPVRARRAADAPEPSEPAADASGEATAPDVAPRRGGEAESDASPKRGGLLGAESGTKLSTLLGVAAAVLLTVFVNVIAARHTKRWDLTTGGLFTLSPATLETLHRLEEPVTVHVLLSSRDPIQVSVRQLLDAYRAESPRLSIVETDPDRAPAEFFAVQQRYGIVAGRTEDGRVVTDAAIIVARGEQPYFITADELVSFDDPEDLRARPRLEQALTGAIRNVLDDERPRVCFSAGHGEPSIELGGEVGLAVFRDRLTKNNYEVTSVFEEGGATGAVLDACRLLIVAGPSEPVPPEHVSAMRAYVERGGSALIVVGPVPETNDKRIKELGLDPLIELAGVRLAQDFVFELDPAQRSVHGFGETFVPKLVEHPVTAGLLRESRRGAEVTLTVASSLVLLEGAARPERVLVTSDRAFGMVDFFAWAEDPGEPEAGPEDRRGPLVIGVATERDAAPGAERGARLLVIGSSSALAASNWRVSELMGTAMFIESAVSWLASHRVFLDIPDKPRVLSGLRISEEVLSRVLLYVVGLLPLAAALGGILVRLGRRDRKRPARGADA